MWERIVLREEIIEKVEINNRTPVLGQGRRMKWNALHKHVVDESQNYLFIIIILTNKVLFQQLQVVHFPWWMLLDDSLGRLTEDGWTSDTQRRPENK